MRTYATPKRVDRRNPSPAARHGSATIPARILRIVDVETYIEHLRNEGELLAETASAVDPGARVPTCPDWQVRDLVRHVGGIHRWAAANVRDAPHRTDRPPPHGGRGRLAGGRGPRELVP